MKTIKLLLSIFVVMFAFNANAQNTGIAPYVNSTHDYTVTKGTTIGTTTLAWSIVAGNDKGYSIQSEATTKTVKIKWLVEGEYTLQLSETRDGANACPTVRQMIVTVIANNFDVIAELNTPADINGCATIDPNVVIDIDADGSNSNDVFGKTTRVFKITSEGLPSDVTWSFNYAITHAKDADLGDYVVLVDSKNVVDVDASPIVVKASKKEVLITVTYITNKNRQDLDFDLELVISNVLDENSTPEKDALETLNNNKTSYTINAVPATTGITTDN